MSRIVWPRTDTAQLIFLVTGVEWYEQDQGSILRKQGADSAPCACYLILVGFVDRLIGVLFQ